MRKLFIIGLLTTSLLGCTKDYIDRAIESCTAKDQVLILKFYRGTSGMYEAGCIELPKTNWKAAVKSFDDDDYTNTEDQSVKAREAPSDASAR